MFLEGKRIWMREVRHSDIAKGYYNWMQDPEVTANLESRFWPQSIDRIEEYITSMKPPENVFLAIMLKGISYTNGVTGKLGILEADKSEHTHLGNIRLGPINWQHSFAEIGLVIGIKKLWGQGYGTEAISLVRDYAFDKLSLHKLTAGCYASNPASIRAFEKAGFKREGILHSQYHTGWGQYTDEVVLGCLAEEIHPDYSFRLSPEVAACIASQERVRREQKENK